MKKLLLTATACTAMALLSACATPTPYAPADMTSQRSYRPGYSETKLEEGRFRLTFSGNDMTSRDTVENYMLYRAAELTTSEGYDWFEVITRGTNEKKRTVYSDPFPNYGGLSWRYYGRSRWTAWGMGFNDDFNTEEYSRYEASAEIVMHKGPKPEDNVNAYDARSVRGNLEPRIVRPVDRSSDRR